LVLQVLNDVFKLGKFNLFLRVEIALIDLRTNWKHRHGNDECNDDGNGEGGAGQTEFATANESNLGGCHPPILAFSDD
jgi:hypothetical protein